MKKTAIILGASGLTGNLLLHQLIDHPDYDSIKLFSRKSLGLNHPKVSEFIGNLLQLEEFESDFKGDEVFCCIGTTAKQTPDKKLYRQIDFGIPVAAAQLCQKNHIPSFLVISAMGADGKSKIFYNRTKGEMEQSVLDVKIPHTYILRPSLIGGNRQESRLGERLGTIFAKLINPLLLGSLRKYRMIEAATIAYAMVEVAQKKPQETILLSDKIASWGKH